MEITFPFVTVITTTVILPLTCLLTTGLMERVANSLTQQSPSKSTFEQNSGLGRQEAPLGSKPAMSVI